MTATAPGFSIHHWKQLQKISEALVSSRFPTTSKKPKKKSNSTVKCQRNTRRREMSHNVYLVLVRHFDHCHVMKVKTKDSKQENIYSPLRYQSMKAWRNLSQKLSVTAMSRMTNFVMVQKRDLKEGFARNFAKQQRWLNNSTLNGTTLRILEDFQKEEKKVQYGSPFENLFWRF